jgi:hypothetical protein
LENKLEIFKDIYPFSEPINNEFLLSSDDELDKITQRRISRIDVYSYPSNKKLFSTKNKYSFFQSLWLGKNYIFNTRENESLLTNLEIKTETAFWQFSVADLGASKVSKIMGVFGQVLVVVAEYEQKNRDFSTFERYIGLDINTGSVLYNTDTYKCGVHIKQFIGQAPFFVFEPNDLLIYTIVYLGIDEQYCYLLVFNTQTGDINTTNLTTQIMAQDGMHFINAASKTDNHLYFKYDGSFPRTGKTKPPKIGAINLETYNIDWIYAFTDWEEGVQAKHGNPKRAGNKIYVHDSMKTLHILELEEGELN